MFLPRWRSSAAVMGGFGYLIFGQDINDSCRKEFYKYDHVNDTWIQLNNFPLAVGRSYSAMQNVNDRLVLFAGVTCLGQSYNDLWYYNRFTDTWLQDVSLPSIERRGGMSCAVENSFYYSCGIDKNNARLNETWMTNIPLSNDKITEENNYQVLPNPVNSELHIILKSIAIDFTNLQLDLYDIFGKEINGITVQHLSDTEKLLWLAHLNSGVYFLKISLKNGSWQMKKIIKN